MQKKLFVQKGRMGGSGGSSYVKYLLYAALGLILLVIVTPHLIGSKVHEPGRKLVQQDKGAMKKELPKPPDAPGENPADSLSAGMATRSEPAPAPSSQAPDPASQAAQRPAAEPQAPMQAALPEKDPAPSPAKPSEPASRAQVLFPKGPGSPAASPARTAAASPVQPAAAPKSLTKPSQPASPAPAPTAELPAQKPKTAAPAAAAPAPGAGKLMYAVQVGCFKDKKAAEDVQRNLKKKGYDVVISPPVTSGGGAYAVSTRPVESMSKASTLVEQIKIEQKSSPVIVKIPATPDAFAGKPAQKPVATAKKPAAAPAR